MPRLFRSILHRCFQRHGISGRPLNKDEQNRPKRKFKAYPTAAYLHVDFAEVQTEEDHQLLFAAIDCTSKGAFAERQPPAKKMLATLPYRVHTVLTDNGIQFSNMRHQRYARRRILDCVYTEHDIEYHFTRLSHSWTTGQVERMNRILKKATVQQYHHQTTAELNEHLQTSLPAYNHAEQLTTLLGLTPHEYVCSHW